MKNSYMHDLYLIAKDLEKIAQQLEKRFNEMLDIKKAA